MCTLDDRILGEKLQNYCSSSEDEDEDEPPPPSAAAAVPNPKRYNTGPKGVIADYEQYKQMDAERRQQEEKQRIEQAKKSITARTWAEDQAERDALDVGVDEEDEEFLEAYRRQRMAEIAQTYKKADAKTTKFFTGVMKLSRDTFIGAVDDEDPLVTVIVLITDMTRPGCREMEKAFSELALSYPASKFCAILAAEVGTSLKFKMEALPAIIVYKGGDVIGNFIRLCDELSDEVCASDLEGFLVDHGIISAGDSCGSAAGGPAAAGSSTTWRQNPGDDESDED